MNKKLTYQLLILVTIATGTWLYSKNCNCTDPKPKPEPETPDIYIEQTGLFSISGNNFSYSCNANILFPKSTANHISPIENCINDGLYNLKNHLQSNPTNTVLVEAYALSQEANTSNYENLGLARANDIKNYIVSRGIDAAKIFTIGKIIDGLTVKNDNIVNPLSIRVQGYGNQQKQNTNDTSTTVVCCPQVKTFDALTLYYSAQTTKVYINKENDAKLAAMLIYINAHKEAKIKIEAHADANGSAKVDENIAQQRANYVRDFFINNGIAAASIIMDNKGSCMPNGSNTTEAGRAKNRRIVITVE